MWVHPPSHPAMPASKLFLGKTREWGEGLYSVFRLRRGGGGDWWEGKCGTRMQPFTGLTKIMSKHRLDHWGRQGIRRETVLSWKAFSSTLWPRCQALMQQASTRGRRRQSLYISWFVTLLLCATVLYGDFANILFLLLAHSAFITLFLINPCIDTSFSVFTKPLINRKQSRAGQSYSWESHIDSFLIFLVRLSWNRIDSLQCRIYSKSIPNPPFLGITQRYNWASVAEESYFAIANGLEKEGFAKIKQSCVNFEAWEKWRTLERSPISEYQFLYKLNCKATFWTNWGLTGCKWSSLNTTGPQTFVSHSGYEKSVFPIFSLPLSGVIRIGLPSIKM